MSLERQRSSNGSRSDTGPVGTEPRSAHDVVASIERAATADIGNLFIDVRVLLEQRQKLGRVRDIPSGVAEKRTAQATFVETLVAQRS